MSGKNFQTFRQHTLFIYIYVYKHKHKFVFEALLSFYKAPQIYAQYSLLPPGSLPTQWYKLS